MVFDVASQVGDAALPVGRAPCRYEPQAALRPRHRHIYQVRVVEEVRWLTGGCDERHRGLLATLVLAHGAYLELRRSCIGQV